MMWLGPAQGPELGLSPQVPEIHRFIIDELDRLDKIAPARFERKTVEPQLSTLFRKILGEAWAG
ncbi:MULTISPECIES: hypothetical protein [unclassified Achromobacter]|uniref:hypothetical protein n=1 Tax=unclassified Achromobacter TaxID=2626865 RepID=UPI0011785E36|nr:MULTISPECIES: hypothetical protein [unclassified Achromobacter]